MVCVFLARSVVCDARGEVFVDPGREVGVARPTAAGDDRLLSTGQGDGTRGLVPAGLPRFASRRTVLPRLPVFAVRLR